MWGLRNDPDAFPKKQRRCLCVEFLRTDEGADALLVVREMFLSEFDFDDWRVNETKTLAEQEIKTPENTDACGCASRIG